MQFGTHDVVVLKPNKADLGSPALGQGVVYRLKVVLTLLQEHCCWIISLLVLLLHIMHGLSLKFLCHRSMCNIEQDSSITVAFDDVPEDGLNNPLRLEKVANEVCYSEFVLLPGFSYWLLQLHCVMIVFFYFKYFCGFKLSPVPVAKAECFFLGRRN